jgi:predicted phosphodiesterase
MRIYYASDIHLEFYNYNEYPLPIYPDDVNTSALALCGDIGMVDKQSRRTQYKNFISRLAKNFKYVIVVRGNHESYKYSFDKTPIQIKELFKNSPNIYFLDNEFLELEGKLIYGSPFFTDFLGDYLCEWTVGNNYNDFKQVRNNNHSRRLSTQDYITFYKASVEHCKTRSPDLILSHYLPSLSLLEYTTGLLDKGMGGEALRGITSEGNKTPSVWIYGHDHSRKETMLGGTLCLSNCFGYYGNEHFKKEIVFDKWVDV